MINKDDATRTLYEFTATEVADNKKSARFTSPANYPEGTVPEYAIHQGLTKVTAFDPKAVKPEGGYQLCSEAELANRYPLCAKYDTETKTLKFQPILSLMRFEATLPDDAAKSVAKGMLTVSVKAGTSILYVTSEHCSDRRRPQTVVGEPLSTSVRPSAAMSP